MGEKNNESHLGPESAGCACLCMRVHLLHNYLCMPPTDGWKSNESFFNFHFVNYFFFGPQTWDACTFRDKYSGLACGHKEAVCIHGKLYTEPQTRVFTFKLVRGIEGDSHAAIIVHFCWWSNDFFRGVCFSFIYFFAYSDVHCCKSYLKSTACDGCITCPFSCSSRKLYVLFSCNVVRVIL